MILGRETAPIEGLTYMWKDISFLHAAILPDAQGSTLCSPYLQRNGLDNKKQNPFNMRRGMSWFPRFAFDRTSPLFNQGVLPRLFSFFTQHIVWIGCSCRECVYAFLPLPSHPFVQDVQVGTQTNSPAHRDLHTGICSSCCSALTHLLLDKPTGWRAELLIPVINFFWIQAS